MALDREKFKKILLNLLVLVASILFVCALIEAGLRFSIPKSNINLFEHTSETKLSKVMKPNIQGVVYGVPFQTNNLGFRDGKSSIAEKAENEFRIIVLGDSYTVSAGVAFKDIYTQILGDSLQHKISSIQIKVINLGVGGYEIVRYLYLMQEVGLALQPDLVIVAVFPYNDFSLDTYYTNRRVTLGLEKPPSREGIESLYLYRIFGYKLDFAINYIGRELRKLRFGSSRSLAQTDSKPVSEGWKRNVAALGSMSRIASEKEIPFLVILLPYTANFHKAKQEHQKIISFCKEMGIECIDMVDDFIKSGIAPQKFRLNIIDNHPNEKYHRIVARRLREYLKGRIDDLRSF